MLPKCFYNDSVSPSWVTASKFIKKHVPPHLKRSISCYCTPIPTVRSLNDPHQVSTGRIGIMADKEGTVPVREEEDEIDLNYQAPAQKSLQEIQELDKDDESLNKYKQTLLGAGAVVSDPSVPNVQVTRLTLMCDQAPGPITMDLTGDLEALKKQNFNLKEGVEYKVKIHFKVNREIVCGLKYIHLTHRKGIRVDKAVYMVGSYGPRVEEHEFVSPVEEAPKGLLVRGGYHIKSCFTDDDKTNHLSWEWNLHIKKEWDSTE